MKKNAPSASVEKSPPAAAAAVSAVPAAPAVKRGETAFQPGKPPVVRAQSPMKPSFTKKSLRVQNTKSAGKGSFRGR